MAKRNLFIVETVLGYRVVLSRDRWRTIVRYKHPAVRGHEESVEACIADPDEVRASSRESEVHLYYKQHEHAYLCVVVAPANDESCFVVTAYFTENVKEGEQLWKR